MTVALVNQQCQVLALLALQHEEDCWEYAKAILLGHKEPKLWIIKVSNAEVLLQDIIIRGPNIWDRSRMHILGRVVAKKCDGRVSLVDRG